MAAAISRITRSTSAKLAMQTSDQSDTAVRADLSNLMVYNVPPTCPLSQKTFTVIPSTNVRRVGKGELKDPAVYCPAIRIVCDSVALTHLLAQVIIKQLGGMDPKNASPKMTSAVPIAGSASAAEADSEPSSTVDDYVRELALASHDTFHRIIVYYLGEVVSPNCFRIFPYAHSTTKCNKTI